MNEEESDSEGTHQNGDSAEAVQAKRDEPTNDEIERERARWGREQRAKHLNFVRQFSFHTSTTFMDYLHGDVNEEEAESACEYEYTRESKAVWEAAKQRDALQQANPKIEADKIALHIVGDHRQEPLINPMLLVELLACESFPKKDWNELSEVQRKRITRLYPAKKVPPLGMTEVMMLDSMGVFDEFKAMAANARALLKESLTNPRPRPDVLPVFEAGQPIISRFSRKLKRLQTLSIQNQGRRIVQEMRKQLDAIINARSRDLHLVHALFTLDFRETKQRMLQRFEVWLDQDENRKRHAAYKRDLTGTTGKPLDRLKDLAAWRLYRECGNDWNKANEFANDNRKRFTSAEIREKYKTKEDRKKIQPGSPKPFHNAKPKKEKQATGKLIPTNEADLFGEDSDARKAKARAWEFRAEMMPREFATPGREMLKMFVKIQKLASNG